MCLSRESQSVYKWLRPSYKLRTWLWPLEVWRRRPTEAGDWPVSESLTLAAKLLLLFWSKLLIRRFFFFIWDKLIFSEVPSSPVKLRGKKSWNFEYCGVHFIGFESFDGFRAYFIRFDNFLDFVDFVDFVNFVDFVDFDDFVDFVDFVIFVYFVSIVDYVNFVDLCQYYQFCQNSDLSSIQLQSSGYRYRYFTEKSIGYRYRYFREKSSALFFRYRYKEKVADIDTLPLLFPPFAT